MEGDSARKIKVSSLAEIQKNSNEMKICLLRKEETVSPTISLYLG